MQELKRPDVPTPLKTCSHLLFGNIEIISNFHAAQFYPDLRDSDKTPRDIAICFLKNVGLFIYIYVFLSIKFNHWLYFSRGKISAYTVNITGTNTSRIYS